MCMSCYYLLYGITIHTVHVIYRRQDTGTYDSYDGRCFQINLSKNEWVEMPELNYGRSRATATCLGGNIYVFGG